MIPVIQKSVAHGASIGNPANFSFSVVFAVVQLYTHGMLAKRGKQRKRGHTCLVVNPKSAAYKAVQIRKLAEQLRAAGEQYTICEASSGNDLLRLARSAANGQLADLGSDAVKRGAVTGLVAAGGDGTVNLVARAAVEADLPLAVLQVGRQNNIARSLYGNATVEQIGARLILGNQRKIDCGLVGDMPFFSAIGLGLLPALHQTIQARGLPRFGLGWGALAEHALAQAPPTPLTVKLDSFRFECTSRLFMISLLPMAAAIPFSPASLTDDSRFELVFDADGSPKQLTDFIKQASKREYLFGSTIRLYRGASLTCHPIKGKQLYLDGELVTVPGPLLEVTLAEKQLRVIA